MLDDHHEHSICTRFLWVTLGRNEYWGSHFCEKLDYIVVFLDKSMSLILRKLRTAKKNWKWKPDLMVRGITYTKQLIWKVQTKNSRKCSNISVKKYLYNQAALDVVKLSLKWIFNQFNMTLQSFTWQSGILFNFNTFAERLQYLPENGKLR